MDAVERDLRSHGLGYRYHRVRRARGAGAGLEPARGRARPVDGDEIGRQVALVRRRHRRRARKASRLHRTLPGDHPAPRHDGRRLRPCLGRLPARAAGREHEDRGRRSHVRGDCQRRVRPRSRIRRRTLRRARRRAGAQPVHAQDVRAGHLRRVLLDQAHIRSRTASSTPARSSTRRRSPPTCATAPGMSRPIHPPTSTTRSTAAWPARWTCAAGSARAGRSWRARCVPSYMATLEETHSTRGRANVLRLAMTGRIGEAGLGDQGVYDTLDLCLECRACKAECPVGVDVARFKSEFLADYWSAPRHVARSAHARQRPPRGRTSAAASRRVSNWLARTAPVRRLNERAARHRSAADAARVSAADARRPARREPTSRATP